MSPPRWGDSATAPAAFVVDIVGRPAFFAELGSQPRRAGWSIAARWATLRGMGFDQIISVLSAEPALVGGVGVVAGGVLGVLLGLFGRDGDD